MPQDFLKSAGLYKRAHRYMKTPSNQMMNARVLLIGPNDQQFEQLKVALEQEGFLTETATDAMQGLEIGGRFQPHLVVTEAELRGISGFELSSRIFSGQAGFRAKVVFYAQFYRDEKSRQAASGRYGALGYFVRPFQKHALLKTVGEIFSRIDAEKSEPDADRGNALLPPSPKTGEDRPPQQFLEAFSKPESSAPKGWLLETLDSTTSQCSSLVVRSREQMGVRQLRPSGKEGQSDRVERRLARMTALVQEVVYSTPYQEKAESDQPLTEQSYPPEVSNASIEPNSPASGNPSVALSEQTPDDSEIPLLSKQPVSSKSAILVAAAAVFAVLGLSLALRFLSSSSSSSWTETEVTRRLSEFPTPAKSQMSSSTPGGAETSTAPPALNQIAWPSDAASEAVTRWLRGSTSNLTTTKHDTTTSPEPKSKNAMPQLPDAIDLIIRDISPVERQPFLTTMSRPALRPPEIRAMGSTSYLVSLELDQNGTVIDVRVLTSETQGNFPTQILDTVRKWRFVPRDKSQQGAWVKYFTFKAQSPAS